MNINLTRFYWILAVFASAIFVAQEYYIVNEETLILLAFILFIGVVYDIAGFSFSTFFNDGGDTLLEELLECELYEEELYLTLMYNYEKQVVVAENVVELVNWWTSELMRMLEAKSFYLQVKVLQKIQSNLHSIKKQEDTHLQELYIWSVNYLLVNVLNRSEELNNSSIKEGVLKLSSM